MFLDNAPAKIPFIWTAWKAGLQQCSCGGGEEPQERLECYCQATVKIHVMAIGSMFLNPWIERRNGVYARSEVQRQGSFVA